MAHELTPIPSASFLQSKVSDREFPAKASPHQPSARASSKKKAMAMT
jgi:hypothetical protein